MRRPTNGFAILSIAAFENVVGVIVGKMSNNAYYPEQQGQVTNLKLAWAELQELVQKATNGSKTDILLRDDKRSSITNMLHRLGNEVNAVAQGDEVMLESTGFNYTKSRKPSPPLQKPEPPKVSLGVNAGELVCTAKTQRGSKSITFMLSPDPQVPGLWMTVSATTESTVFRNLESGKRYYIKYKLIGVRSQEVVSDTVSFIPQ